MKTPMNYAQNALPLENVLSSLRDSFGENVVKDVREYRAGNDQAVIYNQIWLTTSREKFLELVEFLFGFDFLHFHVLSGNDDGDVVSLNYHFSLFRVAGRDKRLGVTVSVAIPKSDLVMPSLFKTIPGVEYSEREMREMLGIDFEGLQNKALVFLPEDWDESIKPWRRDETGPDAEHLRELS
ncbi:MULTISPECIES: NADH-quinone oxidoreductase subunit C [Aminobacterium]|jgi:membrane-bound hydrogenase subunit beta|uniref:NADH dehydrogenase (Ubiquinone) 30 kDa subunit n=1 Tax=Aminobacterium colombiense (strain DSM 12261 / ALA-1) TaxID=572547 RepID=D5EFQ4_AMICL|nr:MULTISPECIES: NADH-quinone oxidoreductase subunit C [Aminobacterium]MDD2379634.1 NADH-quinone oxidoreductase subunit C [Aminobacterium colombiense]ADE57386.1 NADH dehydrogenase (ubiquinone) 30 kDa subunit [Aminobacterium colombiense DSM 12261]MDD3768178.1 NADH-quinone oxidoreductase subunit C [Aminobacterium colombiense]MDD4265489.1 NADH-quinone oxidoreductase subunit C [Aminobacterium colombiense]MDD4585532.1 NADH-quinone oxidoreductase subunit C [Aminobacterium colombiense]